MFYIYESPQKDRSTRMYKCLHVRPTETMKAIFFNKYGTQSDYKVPDCLAKY